MQVRVVEKDGRLWALHEERGWIVWGGPTSVQVVEDPVIDGFLETVRRPEVGKALMDCKDAHDILKR